MSDFLADLIFILVGMVAVPLGRSIGGAVVALSLAFRLMLVPLTYVAARRAAARRRRLAVIQPEVARIEHEYANDPNRRAAAIGQLYAERGLLNVEPTGLLALLLQFPVVCALLVATGRGLGAGARFLTIGNLATPSLLAASVATLLVLAGPAVTAAPHHDSRMLVPSLLIWVLVAWAVPALLALHWASLGLVTLGEAIIVRHAQRSAPSDLA